MNKSILWLIGLLFAVSCTIVSCSETDEVEDPYANWADRNQLYIDSIAKVARANEGSQPGQWKIIRSWKLPSLGLDQTPEVNDYVYAKIIKNGDGATPLFTDTVGVNYRGKLIDGTVFDQSYLGELDNNTAFPVNFDLNNSTLRVGFATALMAMQVGDRWEVYMPYGLAYGAAGYNSIPGYSTLLFDIDFVDIYPLKGNERSLSLFRK